MESIAPSLQFCLFLRQGLEKGDSVRSVATKYVANHDNDYAYQLAVKVLGHAVGSNSTKGKAQALTIYQQALNSLVEQGLRGAPILTALLQMELEIKEACEAQIKDELLKMPFKVLIPLLFFQFPALVMLFLGPFLRQLTSNF